MEGSCGSRFGDAEDQKGRAAQLIGMFDAGFLYILFDDKARIPCNKSGVPVVDHAQERIDFLVRTMSQRKDKIIVSTPALAEFMLLAADRWSDYLTIIRRKAVFEIAGFDDPEAVEPVEHWRKHGDSKRLKQNSPETWAKLKYDRQIIAIASTHRVECIYSTDSDLQRFAVQLNKACHNLTGLPLPPPTQTLLPLAEGPDPDG